MAEQTDLTAVLRCPRCQQGGMARERAGWICGACSAGYPVLGDIPWLFAEPQSTLSEWRSRLHFLLLQLAREAATLRTELAGHPGSGPPPSALTRARLEQLAAAHEDQGRRLQALLAPLGIPEPQTGYATHLALRTRLPSEQGLTNYYVNVHRDWSWGAAENQASVALIESALPAGFSWGRTLVLGAGAGRLAYDLHARFSPALTVATDFNPLLLFVAHVVVGGGAVELYEFPLAPRRLADHAVLRQLRAPAAAGPGLQLVAADALNPPFAPGSFDTVVTPWFIDIIDEDFGRFAARVNALLRPGGSWINFGSLVFAQPERAMRFSIAEVLEIMGTAGFALPEVREATIPYMQSPASRHARLETVLAWCARQERTVAAPAAHAYLPEWLLQRGRPVPPLEDFRVQAASTRILAFLMAMIDGKRSIEDMARMLVEQRLMTAPDAEAAVRSFLTRMYDDSRRRAGL